MQLVSCKFQRLAWLAVWHGMQLAWNHICHGFHQSEGNLSDRCQWSAKIHEPKTQIPNFRKESVPPCETHTANTHRKLVPWNAGSLGCPFSWFMYKSLVTTKLTQEREIYFWNGELCFPTQVYLPFAHLAPYMSAVVLHGLQEKGTSKSVGVNIPANIPDRSFAARPSRLAWLQSHPAGSSWQRGCRLWG